MTPTIDLWVEGRPRPKGRPRMTRRGRAYTPRTTHEAENLIVGAYHQAYGHEPQVDPTAPLVVTIDYSDLGQRITVTEVETPKSPLRGDVDNLAKLSLDALQNAGAIHDDVNVQSLWVVKHPKGTDPRGWAISPPVPITPMAA